MSVSRRKFLAQSTMLGAAAVIMPGCLTSKKTGAAQYVYDPYEMDVILEYILVAHSDFEAMKGYVEKYPNIVNATADWGDGDFESAIGAAGHMGHRDYATYLISKGARFDIFVMTMLGYTDLVIDLLKTNPNLINSIGPHGFTLLHHAEVGGKPGEDLFAYLQEQGLTEKFIKTFKKD